MKKIPILLLSFLLLFALFNGILQTDWAKIKIMTILQKNLRESGWSLDVKKINKAFPSINMEGVTLSSPDLDLNFGTLKGEISFTRIWKKEIVFPQIEGSHFSWGLKTKPPLKKAPLNSSSSSFRLTIKHFHFTDAALFDSFVATASGKLSVKQTKKNGIQLLTSGTILPNVNDSFLQRTWDFNGKLSEEKDHSWKIQRATLSSDISSIKGFGRLNPKGKVLEGVINIDSKLPFLDGDIFGKIILREDDHGLFLTTNFITPSLFEITDIHGVIQSVYKDKQFTSTSSIKGIYLGKSWDLSAPFLVEKEEGITFNGINLSSDLLEAEGNLSISKDFEGRAGGSFKTGNLNPFYTKIYGQASGSFDYRKKGDHDQFTLETKVENGFYESIYAKKIDLFLNLQNPFDTIKGSAKCSIKGGKWKELELEEAVVETSIEGENWPFTLETSGTLGHPIALEANGFWNYSNQNLLLSLHSLNGSFFNEPLVLQEPISFVSTPDTFSVSDFSLGVGNAQINGEFYKKNKGGKTKLKIHDLPIDFLSINPLDVKITGRLNLDLAIEEEENALIGKVNSSLDALELRLLGEEDFISAQGSLKATFERDQLFLEGNFFKEEQPLLSIDLTLPIHLELFPPLAEPYPDRQLQGHLLFKGKVEEILDFYDLKSHRLEGRGTCDFTLSGTVRTPSLEGNGSFTEGAYLNYLTGTEVKDIHALFEAEKTALTLTSLEASDLEEKGKIMGKGKIDLNPKEHFPFVFDLSLFNVRLNTFDLAQTEASGAVQISGDLFKAVAKGEINILSSHITIPNKIPKKIPELPVRYIHEKEPRHQGQAPETSLYPLYLDISVSASDQIFVSGRGLDSEWKGQFHIEGEETDIRARGEIELIKGQFTFSGKVFKLDTGRLTFTGEADTAPVMSLSANTQVKDISITASIMGPLNDPQITLQSSPPLPIGSIMSYLLFGEDLAEISSFQALQLANSVAALTGGGAPNILEKTKQSIGIDRLEIVSISNGSDGNEKMGIEVGKYVTEGVLVSLSQGAENSSPNIRIEVELRENLSLILESDQANEQKQGKFSFRWARNY